MDSGRALVVVIDDEPALLETFAMLLDRVGLDVLAAPSAREAVDGLRSCGRTPDLVIADLRLAEGALGTDAIREVERYVRETVPAIILTGDTSPEKIREAQHSGFSILHKPVKVAVLKTAIAGIVDLPQ